MRETVDIHALAGAYVLDAVDDLERAAFERHLRDCPACAAEVAELRETAGWLTYPVAWTPPSKMRGTVLAAIASTPQERAGRAEPARTAGLDRWRRWGAAAVAACVLGIGVGAGTWTVAEQRIRDARAQNARIDAVLAAPDARLVSMEMAGGRVSMVVSPSRDAAVAVVSGLSSPGADQVYQLWMLGEPGTAAVSVGMLPREAGDGRAYIEGLGAASQFGVSREPEGGSVQPTPTQIVGVVPF